mgnify:CR=1 FL=1
MIQAMVIEEKCTGCGVCAAICSEVFEMEDALAKVKADPVPESTKEECVEAAESCPVQAIAVTG